MARFVNRFGVRANYIAADLSKLTDIDNLWSKVIELYPDGIDILINNAGESVEFSGVTRF